LAASTEQTYVPKVSIPGVRTSAFPPGPKLTNCVSTLNLISPTSAFAPYRYCQSAKAHTAAVTNNSIDHIIYDTNKHFFKATLGDLEARKLYCLSANNTYIQSYKDFFILIV